MLAAKRNPTKHLYLIRGKGGICDDEIWEEHTVVVVLGDRAGFCHLADTIRAASSRSAPQRLAGLDCASNTMACLVLAPVQTLRRQARVALFERVILVEGEPRMELVFMGNRAGYDRIAAVIEKFGRKSRGNVETHEHLDRSSVRYHSLLEKARVALNLRAPVCPWAVAKLEGYRTLVFDRSTRYLPDAMDFPNLQDWEYTVPNPIHLARYDLTLT